MPKNRQYYRKIKYPDKVTKPKRLVFVRIFLFRSAGSKITYFPTVPSAFYYFLKSFAKKPFFLGSAFTILPPFTLFISEM